MRKQNPPAFNKLCSSAAQAVAVAVIETNNNIKKQKKKTEIHTKRLHVI